MPTFEAIPGFWLGWRRLTRTQQEAFLRAARALHRDLSQGEGFRKGLRVKRVQGTKEIWELTWAADGRATWQYGPELKEGHPHIVWRRIGGHDIFDRP